MPECPRCHQPVESRAIACPYCRTQLKAYGHPGMPLYRAEGNDPLCLTCTYHLDNTCTYPKRPTAMECTLYSDSRKPAGVVPPNSLQAGMFSKSWFKRNLAWLTLLGLVVLSLLIVLTR